MIPKRIIQTYKYNRLPLLFNISQNIIKTKCNQYNYKFYNKDNIITFIKSYYPQYINIYNVLTDKNKVFFFSLLELYKNGGIYIDLDFIIHKNLDELLHYDCSIFPLSYNKNIGKYFIMANKNNKFILYLILNISCTYNTNSNFITNNILYDLYKEFNKKCILICSEFNECFGNFGYHIKINSHGLYNNKYPEWFMSIVYNKEKKIKIQNILSKDIQWISNSTYYFK